jgi:hypothetical protein
VGKEDEEDMTAAGGRAKLHKLKCVSENCNTKNNSNSQNHNLSKIQTNLRPPSSAYFPDSPRSYPPPASHIISFLKISQQSRLVLVVKILETRFWEKLVEGSFWENLENKLKKGALIGQRLVFQLPRRHLVIPACRSAAARPGSPCRWPAARLNSTQRCYSDQGPRLAPTTAACLTPTPAAVATLGSRSSGRLIAGDQWGFFLGSGFAEWASIEAQGRIWADSNQPTGFCADLPLHVAGKNRAELS